MQKTPIPKKIASNMLRVAKKLINGGDTALHQAKAESSPLRARRYDTREGGRDNRSDDPGFNDPTGAASCARVERGGSLFDTYVRALWGLDSSLVAVESAHDKILGKAQAHATKRKSGQLGVGYCDACGEYMPGTQARRLRDRFCGAHYRGWHRAKRNGETRDAYLSRIRASSGVGSGDATPQA